MGHLVSFVAVDTAEPASCTGYPYMGRCLHPLPHSVEKCVCLGVAIHTWLYSKCAPKFCAQSGEIKPDGIDSSTHSPSLISSL